MEVTIAEIVQPAVTEAVAAFASAADVVAHTPAATIAVTAAAVTAVAAPAATAAVLHVPKSPAVVSRQTRDRRFRYHYHAVGDTEFRLSLPDHASGAKIDDEDDFAQFQALVHLDEFVVTHVSGRRFMCKFTDAVEGHLGATR